MRSTYQWYDASLILGATGVLTCEATLLVVAIALELVVVSLSELLEELVFMA